MSATNESDRERVFSLLRSPIRHSAGDFHGPTGTDAVGDHITDTRLSFQSGRTDGPWATGGPTKNSVGAYTDYSKRLEIEDPNHGSRYQQADDYFPRSTINPWATYSRAPKVASRLTNDVHGNAAVVNPFATYRRAPNVLCKIGSDFSEQLNRVYERNQRTPPVPRRRKPPVPRRRGPVGDVSSGFSRSTVRDMEVAYAISSDVQMDDSRPEHPAPDTRPGHEPPTDTPAVSWNTDSSPEIHLNGSTRTAVKHIVPMQINDLRNSDAKSKLNKKKNVNQLVEAESLGSGCDSVTSLCCPCNKPVDRVDTAVLANSSADTGTPAPGNPFIYCRLVAQYPKTSFVLTLSGHLLILLVTVALLLANVDLFPSDFETLPMYNWNVPWRKRDFAWRFRDQNKDRYIRKLQLQSIPKWYRSMAYGRANVVLYYDTGGGNVFTRSHLKRIEDIENNITSLASYQKYCVQDKALKCLQPTSLLRLFDGTYENVDPTFFDPHFNNISNVIYKAKTNRRTRGEFAYFLPKDSSITPMHVSAHLTRTIFPVGYPLDLHQSRDQMEAEMKRFLVYDMKPELERLRAGTQGLDIYYWSFLLFRHDIVIQISRDILLAVGSLLFIFCFIVYHTKSLWISALAVMSIMTSFLTASAIYRLVLGFRYFGYFHVISVFIILGIGADDLFVFIDVWKNTAFTPYPSLAHRLHDAYRKSALSMLFTSLSTAVAFFASAFSPLLALNSFGVFAGILVIVNYISVIIFFPTVVIIYHNYFKDWHWPCIVCMCQLNKLCARCVSKPEHRTRIIDGEQNTSRRDSLYDEQTIGSTGNVYLVVEKDNPAFSDDEKDIKYGFLPFGNKQKTEKVCGDESQKDRTPERSISSPDLQGTSISEFDSINNCIDSGRRTSAPCGQLSQVETRATGAARSMFDSMTSWETKPGILRNRDMAPGSTNCESSNSGIEHNRNNFTMTTEININKKKLLVRFFRDYYFQFVTHRAIRWVIVSVLAVTVMWFAYSASKLHTDSEQVQFYRPSHNYGKALNMDGHSFVANKHDRNVVVYIAWGLQERDVSGCHFSDGRCLGRQRYDATFNPHTPQAQMAMKAFCDTMLNFSPQEIADFHISRDVITGQPEIKCFMENLHKFLLKESIATGVDWTLPWDNRKTMDFMKARGHFYDATTFNESFTDYLEIAISYWLNDGYRFQNTSDFTTFHSLIGEKIGPFSTHLKSDYSVFYGNQIRYLGIQVNLTLGAFTTGYSTGRQVMDKWEGFVQYQMKLMPPGLQNGFQLTKDTWHTISNQKVYMIFTDLRKVMLADAEGGGEHHFTRTMVDNAIIGIVVGILLAFPILTLATQNIIIGFLATFSMCCSIICVVGMIPMFGWKLDILVSLNLCMVVGLSVDYVVHLAEGYHMSPHADRSSRVRDMLEEMGISVFSGACTTLGASVFMLFAQVVFLLRFGIFMFCTIGFSLLFSLGFFTTLMGILGPSGDTGDLRAIFHKLTNNRFKHQAVIHS